MGTRIKNNLSSGFTLIELMIVVAIAGILAMIAMPNYTQMVKNNCITTKVNTLVSSLQFARSEAVKRNQPVTLKANNAAGSNEWGNGWEIVDNKDKVIRVIELGCAPISINETTTNITSFIYTGNGFIKAGGIFKICGPSSNEGRQINISTTGRPAVSDLNCS